MASSVGIESMEGPSTAIVPQLWPVAVPIVSADDSRPGQLATYLGTTR